MQCFPNKDHQHRKCHGYHFQTAKLPSSRCSVCQNPGKMQDVPKLLKIPIRLPRDKMAQIMVSIEDPVVPLERNLYGHPFLARLLWERQLQKILLQHGGENVSNWECLFVHREGLFLSVYVDDIKLAGKKQNIDPMWKVLNKAVDFGEPTSFHDHVYLGCTQRQCVLALDSWDLLVSVLGNTIQTLERRETRCQRQRSKILRSNQRVESH